jgi:hypothetical protein
VKRPGRQATECTDQRASAQVTATRGTVYGSEGSGWGPSEHAQISPQAVETPSPYTCKASGRLY